MLLQLILLFTILPICEVYLLIKVGRSIGAFDTISLVFITGIVGAYTARAQGQYIWSKFQKRKLQRGEVPTETLLQGLLVFMGGLLLLTPGFITDGIGFAFIIPVTRNWCALKLKKYLSRKVKMGQIHVTTNVNGQWYPNDAWQEDQYFEDEIEERPIREAEVIDLEARRNKDLNS